jgi:DNA-binding XRE family transcriptional regulator
METHQTQRILKLLSEHKDEYEISQSLQLTQAQTRAHIEKLATIYNVTSSGLKDVVASIGVIDRVAPAEPDVYIDPPSLDGIVWYSAQDVTALREKAHLSVNECAKRIGISRPKLIDVEAGRSQMDQARFDALLQLALHKPEYHRIKRRLLLVQKAMHHALGKA